MPGTIQPASNEANRYIHKISTSAKRKARNQPGLCLLLGDRRNLASSNEGEEGDGQQIDCGHLISRQINTKDGNDGDGRLNES